MTARAQADPLGDHDARRAHEYERVYQRAWRQDDLRAHEAMLGRYFAGRRVLELACGTGGWTGHGAALAAHWLATDLRSETLALAQAKPMPPQVRFQVLDAYTLDGLDDQAGAPFDAAFAGCWWSHVPHARLSGWLATLHEHLAPGARVLMLDNLHVEGESTPIARRDADGNGYQQRRLDDGSVHEVLKNFPQPDEAINRLGPRARDARWAEGSHYWTLSYQLI